MTFFLVKTLDIYPGISICLPLSSNITLLDARYSNLIQWIILVLKLKYLLIVDCNPQYAYEMSSMCLLYFWNGNMVKIEQTVGVSYLL